MSDLTDLRIFIVSMLRPIINEAIRESMDEQTKKTNQKIAFYSPIEFSKRTSVPYSTVIYRCKTARLKARQDMPNGTWLIHASELERYINEANNGI